MLVYLASQSQKKLWPPPLDASITFSHIKFKMKRVKNLSELSLVILKPDELPFHLYQNSAPETHIFCTLSFSPIFCYLHRLESRYGQ